MIQNYAYLTNILRHYKQVYYFNKNFSGIIQKITSSPHLVCIHLRIPGKTIYLYIGRGNNYEGLWVDMEPLPSRFRVKDSFLEYLRKHLVGIRVEDLSIDDKDRILEIRYQEREYLGSFQFFWCGRKMYFLNFKENKETKKKEVFFSWTGKTEICDNIRPVEFFDKVGRTDLTNIIEGKRETFHNYEESKIIKYFDKIDNDLKNISFKNKKLDFLKRKIKKIKDDLDNLNKWHNYITSFQSENIDLEKVSEITIGNQKLKLDKLLSHYQKVNIIFTKYKSVKKGIKILEQRLNDTEVDYKNELLAGNIAKIDQIKIIRPFWVLKSENIKEKKLAEAITDKSYEVLSMFDYKIAIGLNSSGNDQIRSKWANKEDYWFHIDGVKSAHLIIKKNKDRALEQRDMLLAACLLKEYSSYEQLEIPIVYTKVKHIKGVKGKAGLVTYKNEKHIRIVYQKNWRAIISTD